MDAQETPSIICLGQLSDNLMLPNKQNRFCDTRGPQLYHDVATGIENISKKINTVS